MAATLQWQRKDWHCATVSPVSFLSVPPLSCLGHAQCPVASTFFCPQPFIRPDSGIPCQIPIMSFWKNSSKPCVSKSLTHESRSQELAALWWRLPPCLVLLSSSTIPTIGCGVWKQNFLMFLQRANEGYGAPDCQLDWSCSACTFKGVKR